MFVAQDYQAEMEAFQQKTEREHIIDWVQQEVVKSITPQLVCLKIIILSLCQFTFSTYRVVDITRFNLIAQLVEHCTCIAEVMGLIMIT